VLAAAEPLEQALRHLVQNALDASPPGVPVLLEVRSSGIRGEIAVVDAGEGMSPQFLRQDLFRPFVSTKENGFGVGACEARELIRGMGGRLEVESCEGVGSRFTISLPLAEASRLLARRHAASDPDMNEKAA
jgi:signal transduction histidine kinase